MEDDTKQPGLSWSAPIPAEPKKPEPAKETQAAPAQKLGFPSGTKIPSTQAPMYAGLLVLGVIVGALLSSAWSSRTTTQQSNLATSAAAAISATSTVKMPQTTPTEAPIIVADQPAGSSVAIANLSIAKPTWVVVYVSREGKPGLALGARLFFAGDKQGKVGLLRNTQAGQSYFVGLSVDNGDRVFSLTKDRPLADADGGPLWATFRAI